MLLKLAIAFAFWFSFVAPQDSLSLSEFDIQQGYQIIFPSAFGNTMSGVGDFNGDGIGDVLQANAGRACLIFGSQNSSKNINASNLLPGEGIFILTDPSYYFIAFAGCGDVNKDGFNDLMISRTGGAVYIIYGKRIPVDIDCAEFNPSLGFLITGSNDLRIFGQSMSGAGDFNGDGFGDMIINSQARNPALDTTITYIVYGGTSLQNIDVGSMTPSQGFQITGINNSNTNTNWIAPVSSAGDFNKDGFADILIGASQFPSSTYTVNGAAYMIYGSNSYNNFDITNLTPTQGFQILGYTGSSLNQAGDFNGDGISDIIIGVEDFSRAYVLYGTKTSQNVMLSALDSNQGLEILGTGFGDYFGCSVSSAGDFNGDGIADVVIGATNAGPDATGTVFIIYGIENSNMSYRDVNILTSDQGFKIFGTIRNGQIGSLVSYMPVINNVSNILIYTFNSTYIIYSPFEPKKGSTTSGNMENTSLPIRPDTLIMEVVMIFVFKILIYSPADPSSENEVKIGNILPIYLCLLVVVLFVLYRFSNHYTNKMALRQERQKDIELEKIKKEMLEETLNKSGISMI